VAGDAATEADKLSDSDRRDTQRIPPGGTPGYAVMHVRAGVRVSESVDVSLAVENVFDEDYRVHGSGVNEPGRNAILTASCTF
jgi:hemoglobin/transferrin/lactoferrin receptor protein